ncbi:von Hippel-Lindau tumor suppressor homolog [Physella acuta]|uniref:von Hippel-Lindau tumor suppressor homolog n=1 Tax=Physella acuta TaxID=109671 RepID=UPI0027DC967B|nr:von Hippel-Lindau tumor suppressor homolog [Physella acuta]
MTPPTSSNNKIKSVHHDLPAYISFYNRANFPVDIVWIDYRGDYARYWQRLQPGEYHNLDTYVTHPWIAWNSDTLENARINNSKVFYPEPYNGGNQRTIVYIDRPMQSLLDICLQTVRLLVDTDKIEELEIPLYLIERLKKRRNVIVKDVLRRRR